MHNNLVTYEVAVEAYGCTPNLTNDNERAAFFAVWALLIVELDEAIRLEKIQRTDGQ